MYHMHAQNLTMGFMCCIAYLLRSLWCVQRMAQQLADAGLQVPPEGNMDELYQSTVQQCLDDKTKKPAAARAPKQATPAGSPTGLSSE